MPVDTRMGKHRSEWLDKAGVRGTQKIRFYDCFEADTAGVVHPRDVIGTLRQHSERLAALAGVQPRDRRCVALVQAIIEGRQRLALSPRALNTSTIRQSILRNWSG